MCLHLIWGMPCTGCLPCFSRCTVRSAAEQCPAGIGHFRPCFLKLWALVSKDRICQQSSALCRCTMGAVVVAPPCPLAWHLGGLGLQFLEPHSMLGVLPLAQSSTSRT